MSKKYDSYIRSAKSYFGEILFYFALVFTGMLFIEYVNNRPDVQQAFLGPFIQLDYITVLVVGFSIIGLAYLFRRWVNNRYGGRRR